MRNSVGIFSKSNVWSKHGNGLAMFFMHYAWLMNRFGRIVFDLTQIANGNLFKPLSLDRYFPRFMINKNFQNRKLQTVV